MYISQREFIWYFLLKPAVSKQGDVGIFCVLSPKIFLEISNIKLEILNNCAYNIEHFFDSFVGKSYKQTRLWQKGKKNALYYRRNLRKFDFLGTFGARIAPKMKRFLRFNLV